MSSRPKKKSRHTDSLSRSAGYKIDESKNPLKSYESDSNRTLSLNINSSIELEKESINVGSSIINPKINNSTLRESIYKSYISYIVLKFNESPDSHENLQNVNSSINHTHESIYRADLNQNSNDNFKLTDLRESVMLISLETIFKKILNDIPHDSNYKFKRLLTKKEKLCCCWRKEYEMNHLRESDLFKLKVFCSRPFSHLIMDNFFSLVSRLEEILKTKLNDNEFLEFIGIQNIELGTNELTKAYAAGVIIHQNFLSRNNINLFREFYSSSNRFKFGQMLLEKTFDKLNYVKLQKFMDDEEMLKNFEVESVIEWFFWFHSGVCQIALESKIKNFDENEAQTIVDIAFRNISRCLNKFKKRFEDVRRE